MFLFRKNIILVPTDYDGVSSLKGVLSFDAYTGKTICNLHTYNVDFDKPLLLGIAVDRKFFKINIKNGNLKSFNFDLDFEIKSGDKISAVLLDVKQSDYDIVLWGSTEINNNWQTQLELMIDRENLVKKPIVQKFESDFSVFENDDLNEEKQDVFENENQKVVFAENENNDNLTGDVELEEYIDKVIELADEQEKSDEKPFEEPVADLPMFYKRLSPQIDKMFQNNQEEKILSEIIPNSKFCKVDFDDGSGYYVFGVIYEAGLPKYLCYGLPAKKDAKPPKELSDFYQWLPLDLSNENDDGFYIMYQDAETGKNISVEIV